MNHDRTHCVDFTEACPNKCFFAKLARDLPNVEDSYFEISFTHYYGSPMCQSGEVASKTFKDVLKELAGEKSE